MKLCASPVALKEKEPEGMPLIGPPGGLEAAATVQHSAMRDRSCHHFAWQKRKAWEYVSKLTQRVGGRRPLLNQQLRLAHRGRHDVDAVGRTRPARKGATTSDAKAQQLCTQLHVVWREASATAVNRASGGAFAQGWPRPPAAHLARASALGARSGARPALPRRLASSCGESCGESCGACCRGKSYFVGACRIFPTFPYSGVPPAAAQPSKPAAPGR